MSRNKKRNIKILVMDVDGTLTDGRIYMGTNGEMMKAFHIKDGLAISRILVKSGIVPVILTGRKSDIVTRRCEEIGIRYLFQGVNDKSSELEKILVFLSTELGMEITFNNVAYIGDDINDIDCMKQVGLSACPIDAAGEVLEIADYVCRKKGGEGAVREFIEWISKKE